jgi:biotin transporter BioY
MLHVRSMQERQVLLAAIIRQQGVDKSIDIGYNGARGWIMFSIVCFVAVSVVLLAGIFVYCLMVGLLEEDSNKNRYCQYVPKRDRS